MFRVIMMIILVFTNFIIQTTLAEEFAIGNTTVNYVLILVVSFAIIRGKIDGVYIGAISGLLQDLFFNSSIGFYTLVYMYIGLLSGYLYRTFYKESVVLPVIIIGIASFIQNFAIYIFTYLLRGRTETGIYFLKIILPEVLLTSAVSIFVYRGYLYINKWIEEKDKREESFEDL